MRRNLMGGEIKGMNLSMLEIKKSKFCSPAGRNIQIDENYLKRNPIQTCNGKAISKLIDYDQNTLNILVPEQYKKYEKKIIKNYKENFYFQKVTIDNYFRKNINKPKNMLKKDKLSINIIYVKSNQSYLRMIQIQEMTKI